MSIEDEYPTINHLPPKVVTSYQSFLMREVDLVREVNLLSGRVEIQMRLIARIIAKIDPAFTEDPTDPRT